MNLKIMEEYPFKLVQEKWQERLCKNLTYCNLHNNEKKFYALVEFPYPSPYGMHIGNPRNYVALDLLCRKKRLEGYNVFFPIGWDVFGVFSEKYTEGKNINLFDFTKANISAFRNQLIQLGISFDYYHEVCTCSKEFIKATQRLFVQLYKNKMLSKYNGSWFLSFAKYCPDISQKVLSADLPEKEKDYLLRMTNSCYIESTINLVFNDGKTEKIGVLTTETEKLDNPVLYLTLDSTWLSKHKNYIGNWQAVNDYINNVRDMSSFEVSEFYKGDEAICLEKVQAVNEAGGNLPVYISKYVNSNLLTQSTVIDLHNTPVIKISDNRKWGEPIPLINCEHCGSISPIQDDCLPIMPGTSTEARCPVCDKNSSLEKGIISNWLASSFYYTFYIDDIFDKKQEDNISKWLPVDHYNGYNGSLHSAQHMLHLYIINCFLNDIGATNISIPIKKRVCHGKINEPDQEKILYSQIVEKYGVDTYRLYVLTLGLYHQCVDWDYEYLEYCFELIKKIWNFKNLKIDKVIEKNKYNTSINEVLLKISDCCDNFDFHELICFLETLFKATEEEKVTLLDISNILVALYPIIPFLCAEINEYFDLPPIESRNWFC